MFKKTLFFVAPLAWLVAGTALSGPAWAQDKITSGIELAGRTGKEAPPYRWYVLDSAGKKQIAEVPERWGFLPLGPGTYQIGIIWKYGDSHVPYTEVRVEKDQVAKAQILSGIELAGRTDKEAPPYRWYVLDSAGKKQIAEVPERWGFLPLGPGTYQIGIVWKYGDSHVPYTDVRVEKDQVAKAQILSGIELAGRTDKEAPPYRWYILDSAGKKQIAEVPERWGFLPLGPGTYQIDIIWKYGDTKVPYADVRVDKDQAAKLPIQSGIELSGRADKDPPPYRWYIQDISGKKRIAEIPERFGFLPLKPGKYSVAIIRKYGDSEVPFAEVQVEKDRVANVRIHSGIELTGESEKEKTLEHWYVFDTRNMGMDQKPFAKVQKEGGFIPLPAGEYTVSAGPDFFPRAVVKVLEGQVAMVHLPGTAERFARVSGAGQKTEKARDPVGYKKLEEAVEKAIRRGGAWLKKQDLFRAMDLNDEYLTIGILALLHAGEFERDPALADRCADYLLRRPLNTEKGTYATGLTAMALRDLDPSYYSQRVLECAQWLVENQGWGQNHKVWHYGDKVPGIGEAKKKQALGQTGVKLEVVRRGLIANPRASWDNSCSQFAVLGLHSAVQAGINIPRETWERVDAHFQEIQHADGGWGYGGAGVTGSMTCAGLASLTLARHYLDRDKSLPDPSVVKGLEWLAAHFTVERNPKESSNHYYYLYGLERVGVLAGTEFLGDHEWYPEGARYLIARQSGDGSWTSDKGPSVGRDQTYLDTCYALLFLRRATLSFTPRPRLKVVEARKPPTLALRYQGKDPRDPGLPPALAPAVELMLDASGSMKDKVEGEPKYLIARRVLNQLVDDIPDHFQVGFRVFGHMGFWGNKPGLPEYEDPRYYTDSELIVSIGSLREKNRRKLIKDWVNFLKPAGATPLVHSLLQARGDFSTSWKGPKMVLLLSDGEENCGGKLADVAKAYQGTGIDVVIHIVGFGVPPAEEKQLKEITRISGGLYFNTTSAKELTTALRAALRSTRYYVEDSSGAKTFGLINGPPLTMKAGSYRVGIPQTGVTPAKVSLEDGQAVQVSLDEAGRLILLGAARLPAGPN